MPAFTQRCRKLSLEIKNRGNIKAGPKDVRKSRIHFPEASEGTGHVPWSPPKTDSLEH